MRVGFIAKRNGPRTNIKIFQYCHSAIVISATLRVRSYPLGFGSLAIQCAKSFPFHDSLQN